MPRDDQVLYRRLADTLRRQILTGELQPGNKLPSERALEGSHHVSRNTVRLALEDLIEEGLVSSSQGKGYFVRERSHLPYYGLRLEAKLRGSSELREVWMSDAQERGTEGTTDVMVAAAQLPPPEVAAALELRESDKIIRRQQTKFIDGEPYAIAYGYFPIELVRGTVIERADEIEPDDVLAELGHKPETYVDRIITRMPTPEDKRLLHIDRGVAVSDFMRTGYDRNGQPVRTQVTTLPGDRFAIVYELPAG